MRKACWKETRILFSVVISNFLNCFSQHLKCTFIQYFAIWFRQHLTSGYSTFLIWNSIGHVSVKATPFTSPIYSISFQHWKLLRRDQCLAFLCHLSSFTTPIWPSWSLCPASEDFHGSDTSLCNYWPFALEPTPSFYVIHFINWWAKCLFCSLKTALFSLGLLHWKHFWLVCTVRSAI